MLFMGPPGTGKNFITKLIALALFGEENSPHLTVFHGRVTFTEESRLEEYRESIISTISSKVNACERSVFVFDEFDRIPTGVLDAVFPFLKHKQTINGVSVAKSIFIFITNLGSSDISEIYHEYRLKGEFLKYVHVEKRLAPIIKQMSRHSSFFVSGLVNLYLPFLPLTRESIVRCIEREASRHGVRGSDVVNSVMEKMDFDSYGFSESGCKRVSTFTDVEVYRMRYMPNQEL